MRRSWVFIGAGIFVAGAAAALLLFVFAPAGVATPEAAMRAHIVDADANSTRLLVGRTWGKGEIIVAAFSTRGERRLAVAFVSKSWRGWRVAAYTNQQALISDVVVGSLLVASSEGGKGQPPWSVAVGEVGDPRVASVEVFWGPGDITSGPRTNDAYLVVHRGTSQAQFVRYLDSHRVELARVPVPA